MYRRSFPKISKAKFIRMQKRLFQDTAIAKELGIRAYTVGRWRRKWGIPALTKQGKPMVREITDARLNKLLKKFETDRGVADELGVCEGAVFKWRKKRGIPPLTKGGMKPWPLLYSKAEMLKLQKKYGIDRRIAEALGARPWEVYRWRKLAGVPSLRKRYYPPIPLRYSREYLVKLQKKYGKDYIMAKKLGVCRSTIARWRKRLAIPAFPYSVIMHYPDLAL